MIPKVGFEYNNFASKSVIRILPCKTPVANYSKIKYLKPASDSFEFDKKMYRRQTKKPGFSFFISSDNKNRIFKNQKNISFDKDINKEILHQLNINQPVFYYVSPFGENSEKVQMFNYLKGYSVKNGNYEIYSYYGKNGLLGRETIFLDKNLRVVKQFGSKKEDDYGIFRGVDINTYSLNGSLIKSEYKTLSSVNDTTLLSTNEIIVAGEGQDTHSVEKLEKGKKKKQIKYRWSWNGKDTSFVEKKLSAHNRVKEFLPLFVSRSEVNKNKRINYIGAMEEKQLCISGLVMSPIQIDTIKEDYIGICNLFNGIITLDKRRIKKCNNLELLDVIAHEMKHRQDFSDCLRIEDSLNKLKTMTIDDIAEIETLAPGFLSYYKHSMDKGIIKKDNPRIKFLEQISYEWDNYEKLCKEIGHDKLKCEDSANSHAQNEVNLFKYFYSNLISFLFD